MLSSASLSAFHEDPASKKHDCNDGDNDERDFNTRHVAVASWLAWITSIERGTVVPATVDCRKVHCGCRV